MLRKKTNGVAHGSRLSSTLTGLTGSTIDRRTFLNRSGLTVGGARRRRARCPRGMVTRAEAQTTAPPDVEIKKSVCTHCSVGCTVMAEVTRRRLDRPGARLRQSVQSRRPLRQGRLGARARARRAAAQISDSSWSAANGQRIPWDDAINEIGDKMLEDPRGSRAPTGLLAGLGQALQRAGLPDPQVRRFLGQQQHRPPGADLSLDHGRGCRQHLGLWRDDQLLQRHPQFARDLPDRRQPRRGPPGVAASPAQRQGAEQRAAHRLRPALHAHRGPCHRVRTPAPRHRRGADLGHPLAHLPERLGGQGVHPPAGMGHGPGPGRGRQMDARGDRAGHRRAAPRRSSGSRARWPTTGRRP